MKILRFYALRELLFPFLVSIVVVTFILLVGNLVILADLLVNKGVSLVDILRMLGLLIPRLLGFTLPAGVLAAVLLVFGNFAQHNEITAAKASGVNIIGIGVPVLIVGFILSLFALILNDQFLPRVTHAYRKARSEMLLKHPTAYIEAGRFIKVFKGYVILTQKVEGNRLEGITIYQLQDEKPTRTIMAESGEIISSEDDMTLTLKLYNGTSDEPNSENPDVFYKLDFKEFELPPISLGDTEISEGEKKNKDMTIDELILKLRGIKDTEDWADEKRLEVRTEIHRKIAFSFGSFVFVVIGIPLALLTRRGEAVVSFGLAAVVVVIYYAFFVWAKTSAIQGILPPVVALWMPNLVLLAVGIFLTKKVVHL